MNRSPRKNARRGGQNAARTAYLTVGKTARILGISPSTLRLWENAGLVRPARSAGRYRLYNSELLKVLKRIKYLRDVKKISVTGIKQILGKSLPAAKAPQPNGAPEPDIGAKLREMRQRLQLGIVEAASRAKISPGFLSAIELAKANPSVATLQRLATTYNTTVLEFFDLPKTARRLIRPGDRRTLTTESGVCIELLSIGTKMLECMIFRVPPKAGSNGSYSHAGEEFIYMLKGELEIWLDEWEYHILKAGR